MRILIAHDGVLANDIASQLRHKGYVVDLVHNRAQADTVLATRRPALLIVDYDLPCIAGHEVITRLRRRGSTLPVLVVSARGDVAARVEALDLGADDYLATPFAMPEFEARVRALVRRGHQSNKELISFGSLTYDRSARGAFQNGEMLNLSSRETALMELLLSQPGKILTMERLAEHVRHLGDQVSHNAIQVYIHRLRRKVEACGVRILAVRGMGYRLEEDSSSIT